MLRDKNESIIISYMALRRWIGILGLLLPFTSMIGGSLIMHLPLQHSISLYYHTNMRDSFVGLLIGVALFLLTYKGYEKIDNLVSSCSGLAALGVALFPCAGAADPVGLFQLAKGTSNVIHLACAGAFFFLLGVNSFFLFTLTSGAPPTGRKKIRNLIYRVCGVFIFIPLASIGYLGIKDGMENTGNNPMVFWLETIMLVAFASSWLVKGETISSLNDSSGSDQQARGGKRTETVHAGVG